MPWKKLRRFATLTATALWRRRSGKERLPPMDRQERLAMVQAALNQLRMASGMDSLVLVARERVSPDGSHAFLFTSGVEDTRVAASMLGAGLSFFPEPDDVIACQDDGRSRLQ